MSIWRRLLILMGEGRREDQIAQTALEGEHPLARLQIQITKTIS